MSLPNYLAKIKSSGMYRFTFDKSQVPGVSAETMRLVVGYSEVGPFNIPTYITSVSDFKAIYGDISKKLEKRGVYFHRLAMQALGSGPILALNLKKFDGETLFGSTINTGFNPTFEPIDTVELRVEDIYDTTRFWEISAEKLNNLRGVNGEVMDQYINICTTNTAKTSATYFIRKASGNKLNGYNISVSDWYSDRYEEMPEYLEKYKNSLISDFFAEIYVFKGKFSASQVLASSTLKKYFETIRNSDNEIVLDEYGEIKLKLKDHLVNPFGDYVDTLDALYNDETSGALGHYVGSLIPYFKNKQGAYVALDILFNGDQSIHNMMMSFNVELLEESGSAQIDLSGRLSIPTDSYLVAENKESTMSLKQIYEGNGSSTLLGNNNAPIKISKPNYITNVVTANEDGSYKAFIPFSNSDKRIVGTLYVSNVNLTSNQITLTQVLGNADESGEITDKVIITCADEADLYSTLVNLGAAMVVKPSQKDFTMKGLQSELCDENGNYTVKELTIKGKKSVIDELKKEVKNSDFVYLATDPDREGEAISWHLSAALKLEGKKVYRITFNEITKRVGEENFKDWYRHQRKFWNSLDGN